MSTAMVEPTTASGFDPFSLAFRNDTESFYPDLLRNSPGFMTLEGILSAYVARHAQVTKVLGNFKVFSSLKPAGLPGMERVDFFNGQPVMNYSDPPQHDRLRRVVAGAFSPARVAHTSVAAQQIVDRLIDKIASRSEIDGVTELAKPLGIEIMLGYFMGLPAEAQRIFIKFVSTLPLLDDVPPGGGKPQAYLDAWKDGVAWCNEAFERARREKSGGMIGLIAEAFEEGGKLSDDETMAMMVVLMTGGFPTIAGGASASLKHLALNPQIAERIRVEPALAAQHFEESLRCDPPVTLVMRFAKDDIEIGGRTIAKGTPVYVMIAGACRDPEVFAEPDRFSIDRENIKAHLAFGIGLHACIGANIARACVPVLVQTIAKRFPELHLANPAAKFIYDTTPRSRHLGSLPLKL